MPLGLFLDGFFGQDFLVKSDEEDDVVLRLRANSLAETVFQSTGPDFKTVCIAGPYNEEKKEMDVL